MKNKIIPILLSVIILLVIVFGLIFKFKVDHVNKNIVLLTKEVQKNNEKLTTIHEQVQDFSEETKTSFETVFSDFEEVNVKLNFANDSLQTTKGILASQFNKTIQLAETYDSILEEEKKKHVDDSEKDNELKLKRYQYKKSFYYKKYEETYNLCNEILVYEKDDLDARYYRMLSLYNINRMDSSKYSEILTDCQILKLAGYELFEVEQIEKQIQMEQKSES